MAKTNYGMVMISWNSILLPHIITDNFHEVASCCSRWRLLDAEVSVFILLNWCITFWTVYFKMCSSEANRLLILDLEKIAYNIRILDDFVWREIITARPRNSIIITLLGNLHLQSIVRYQKYLSKELQLAWELFHFTISDVTRIISWIYLFNQ